MPSIYIGIDVGLDGAIAAIIEGSPMPALFDMPTDTVIGGTKAKPVKRRVVNGSRLCMILDKMKQECNGGKLYALVEAPQMRPAVQPARPLLAGNRPHLCAICRSAHFIANQGVASQGAFMRAGGIMAGLLWGLRIPFEEISPSTWMKDVFHGRSEKLGHRQLATQLYPAAASQLERVKDDGRAEALLLADYAKRHREAPF